MKNLPLTFGMNLLMCNLFHGVNNEENAFAPSILLIHLVGGIFIYGFFYARFVRFVYDSPACQL